MFRLPEDSYEIESGPSIARGGISYTFATDRIKKPSLRTGIGPGALIQTETGPIPAKALQPGQQVLTQLHGFQPVLWVGREHFRNSGDEISAPVRIAPGILGKSLHGQGAVFAPDQYIRLKHQLNDVLFGQENVLARAEDLLHIRGITAAQGRYAVNWVHILFEQVEMIQVDGLWAESMVADRKMMHGCAPELSQNLQDAVPALRYPHRRAAYTHPYPVLNTREVQLLGLGD